MSTWLCKRLALWFGGALTLTLIGAGVTAQSLTGDEPVDTPPATIAEAGKLFGNLLQVTGEQVDNVTWTSDGPVPPEAYLKIRLVSRRDRQQLGMPGVDFLLEELATQQRPYFDSSKPRQENGKTVVDITPIAVSAPVVLVAEEGGYRVDLLSTYARRFKLAPAALATAIYKKIHIALPELPGRNTPQMRRSICEHNVQEIERGLLLYLQDYDEIHPPAKQWMDALHPYTRSEEIFTCPSVPQSQKYGYAFNGKLSGKPLAGLPDPSKTVSIYETTVFKRNAFGMGENRALRHQNGSLYAFDGSEVKWLPGTQKPNFNLKP